MMRALRGLIRVKRALALLTMVGSSGRPSYPRASSTGCSRHGPLRRPKKNRKFAEECAPHAYPARRDGYFTRERALCKSEAAGDLLPRSLLRACCGRLGRLGCAAGDLAFPVAGVAVEGAGRRELAELVPHHVLRDEDRDELPAVVHGEGQADRIRSDRASPRPGLDDLLALSRRRRCDLLGEVTVDESALFYRTSHTLTSI